MNKDKNVIKLLGEGVDPNDKFYEPIQMNEISFKFNGGSPLLSRGD